MAILCTSDGLGPEMHPLDPPARDRLARLARSDRLVCGNFWSTMPTALIHIGWHLYWHWCWKSHVRVLAELAVTSHELTGLTANGGFIVMYV
jgi:hypothetical protein